MASPDTYRQVAVSRPSDHGVFVDVWWIDNAIASVGRRVLDEEGVIWTITAVYGARPRASVEAWNDAQRQFEKVLDG